MHCNVQAAQGATVTTTQEATVRYGICPSCRASVKLEDNGAPAKHPRAWKHLESGLVSVTPKPGVQGLWEQIPCAGAAPRPSRPPAP